MYTFSLKASLIHSFSLSWRNYHSIWTEWCESVKIFQSIRLHMREHEANLSLYIDLNIWCHDNIIQSNIVVKFITRKWSNLNSFRSAIFCRLSTSTTFSCILVESTVASRDFIIIIIATRWRRRWKVKILTQKFVLMKQSLLVLMFYYNYSQLTSLNCLNMKMNPWVDSTENDLKTMNKRVKNSIPHPPTFVDYTKRRLRLPSYHKNGKLGSWKCEIGFEKGLVFGGCVYYL